MDMSEKKEILCVSNAYQKKYYLNDSFENLPKNVKDELQILCVLYTEDIGGILTLYFDEDGNLEFETTCQESDFMYDEIGSVLKIKQYCNEKRELFEALEYYYKITVLGVDLNE